MLQRVAMRVRFPFHWQARGIAVVAHLEESMTLDATSLTRVFRVFSGVCGSCGHDSGEALGLCVSG